MARKSFRKRNIEKDGYVAVAVGDYWVREHRKVWTDAHGYIPSGWIIHHIDEDKKNNTLENLIALPDKIHVMLHKRQKREHSRATKAELEKWVERWLTEQKVLEQEARELGKQVELANARIAEIDKLKPLVGLSDLREIDLGNFSNRDSLMSEILADLKAKPILRKRKYHDIP